MKMFKQYKHLTALMAVLVIAGAMVAAGAPAVVGVAFVALWQLSQFAMSKRCGMCFDTVITPEQIKEFEKICGELKEFGTLIPGLKELAGMEGGIPGIKTLLGALKGQQQTNDDLRKEMKALKKRAAFSTGETGVRWVGNVPFVTDGCARALTSILVVQTNALKDENACRSLCRDENQFKSMLEKSYEFLGMEAKTAMTSTEIPVPTIYVPQIVELVFKYGIARQYCTVFPLGSGTVKLPRLKAGEDEFGYTGVGLAGAGQTINEKRVAAELVTFTANKFGGLIRIPYELEEDTFIPLGQFLARYIARQMAKGEDKTLFLGDGTATYANQTGIAKYCETNAAYLLQLAADKTSPADVTLDNLRDLRAKVSPAILANMSANGQTAAAYHMHPTWEAQLTKFNKYPNFVVFKNEGGKATLDGWPVIWNGVLQPFSTDAQAAKPCTVFGDISYWYLGERGSVRVEVSKEYFFNTDELAMRALERIDVEALAIDAVATLETGAGA